MWKQIANYFGRYPSQAKVAKLLLENGMRVSEGRIYCGEVEVADVALGRAARRGPLSRGSRAAPGRTRSEASLPSKTESSRNLSLLFARPRAFKGGH